MGGLLATALLGGVSKSAEGISRRKDEADRFGREQNMERLRQRFQLARDDAANAAADKRQERQLSAENQRAEDNRKHDLLMSQESYRQQKNLAGYKASLQPKTAKLDPMTKARLDAINGDIDALLKADFLDENRSKLLEQRTAERAQILGLTHAGNNSVSSSVNFDERLSAAKPVRPPEQTITGEVADKLSTAIGDNATRIVEGRRPDGTWRSARDQ